MSDAGNKPAIELVKELRDLSSAPLARCRKALEENGWDIKAALDALRILGQSSVAKRQGRAASEGLVACAVRQKFGVLIEMLSETDFVARNEFFQKTLQDVTHTCCEQMLSDSEALKNATFDSGASVADAITEVAIKTCENVSLGRVASVKLEKSGIIGSYIHQKLPSADMGSRASLVALECEAPHPDLLSALAKQLAMHIVACAPISLDIASLPKELVEHERSIIEEQVKTEGKAKDEAIARKIVDGRMAKYYQGVVLLEQPLASDPSITVAQFIAEQSKVVGFTIKIATFALISAGRN